MTTYYVLITNMGFLFGSVTGGLSIIAIIAQEKPYFYFSTVKTAILMVAVAFSFMIKVADNRNEALPN